MNRKLVLALALTLLVGMLSVSFNVQRAKASGPVYIRADGGIEPLDAPISTIDYVTYTLTGNVTSDFDGIVVEKDSIVVDGAGYTVQGTGSGADLWGRGIDLSGRSNVTLKNANIKSFDDGIYFSSSSNNSVFENNVANNKIGIELYYFSDKNRVCGNSVTNNDLGITLSVSSNNTVSGNSVTNNYGTGVYLASSNNTVSGNNITANSEGGIYLYGSNNIVCGNNIAANNQYGIHLYDSPNNSISGNVFFDDGLFVSDSYLNAVVDNLVNGKPLVYLEDVSNVSVGEAGQVILVNCSSIKVKNQNLSHTTVGVELWGANNTTVCGNNITNNHYGIYLGNSSNNNIYHNNFVNNIEKVYETYYSINNKRDDGYPSGGNYWSDYTSVDVKKGPYQDETGSDGVGDTPYYGDHYPLMNPWPSGFSLHELEVTLSVLTLLPLGNLTSIEAAVTNNGINIEQSVTISLFVNNTIVNSTIISVLEDGSFYTITYPWTPTAKGIYNITAYVNPVSGETSIENNQETEFVSISPPPEVGVKVGDWIRYEYTITGAPSGTTPPTWIKAEFLTVEGANATVRITMHMSDGTEQNQTVTMDIASGGGSLYTFSGFVVCSNCTTGDSVYISGYGNVTIAGETTRTCAGAGRTVIYASFSQYGTQLTYYWDKLTGVMVEASVVSGAMTGTAKATETNMWQASSSGFPIEPIYLYVLAALVMVMAVGAVVFILRRRKKQTEATIPETDRHE